MWEKDVSTCYIRRPPNLWLQLFISHSLPLPLVSVDSYRDHTRFADVGLDETPSM